MIKPRQFATAKFFFSLISSVVGTFSLERLLSFFPFQKDVKFAMMRYMDATIVDIS